MQQKASPSFLDSDTLAAGWSLEALSQGDGRAGQEHLHNYHENSSNGKEIVSGLEIEWKLMYEKNGNHVVNWSKDSFDFEI
jgi:hypothetical protein